MKHMVRILFLYVFLVLSISQIVLGQGLPSTAPENAGMSSERLKRIDTVMQDYINRQQIPGVVTLVARKGKVVQYKAYGEMDVETGKAMSNDAIFRLASMTKALTSTAIMILYEEGNFLLSDPVSKYIPEFKNPQVIVPSSSGDSYTLEPAKREITIRNLLNHTSGITYGSGLHAKLYKEAGMTVGLGPTDATIEEIVKKLAGLPLICHPGEELNYGMSIDVLGYLIEVVSGQTFDEFINARIFKPLGMKDTHFILPREKLPRLVSLYALNPGGGYTKDGTDPSYLCTQTYFAGGAGLVSTAQDYVRFAQMILNNGELDGVRILGRKTVELMSTNSIGDLYAPFRPNSGDKIRVRFRNPYRTGRV